MTHPDAQAQEREFLAGVLRAEGRTLAALGDRVGPEFCAAVGLIVACADKAGAVLVSGLGKSGIIGKKISATLASLGVPSHDIHPAEAVHGDLGRIRRQDCVIALSHSGETDEVVALASIVRQDGVSLISMTGDDPTLPIERSSSLARNATVALRLGPIAEASELVMAPTCSTTAALAVGDALALAAARRRMFTADDFAKRHPGGSLGGLLRPIVDVLRFTAGRNLPVVGEGVTVRAALDGTSVIGRRPGALLIVNDAGALSGIFTDGDLRRLVLKDSGALDRAVGEVMTRAPRTLPDSALVRDAVNMVRESRQDEIPVVDPAGKPVGLLDVQDLIAMKLVKD